MAENVTESPSNDRYQVPLATYHELARADADEKVAIVLHLIAEHPEGRLVLPAREGVCADLSQIDLGQERVEVHWGQQQNESPAWWHRERRSIVLRDADLRGARLTGANLQGAYLWRANLQGAELNDAILAQADLEEANLQGAKLHGADLRRATLWRASLWETDLQEAILQDSDLENANVGHTNLRGADLRGARLQELVLSNCNIEHVYISQAWLNRTRLQRQQLGGAIGEELDGDYEAAEHGYRFLKQNFYDLGDYGAASWAHRKERRMEKLAARQRAGAALAKRNWKAAFVNAIAFTGNQLAEWLCDYGESIWRVIASLIGLVILFTLVYELTGGVAHIRQTASGTIQDPTRDPIELLIFSLGTITRITPLDLEPRNELIGLLAGMEAFLGIALTGLLGFVVGHRIRRA